MNKEQRMRREQDGQRIREELGKVFPAERLKTKLIDLHAWSSDAGFYSLVPQAIVFPETIGEIQALFELARTQGTSVTFRTAGTSLSGQAVTEGILADLSRNWPLVRVEAGGARVRVQPGITGAMVNRHLRSYGRKIGPDPASIQSAMMGGILSNNSSGMCCGVVDNSYHTLQSLKFVLPDGTVLDTENRDDYTRFETSHAALYQGILALRVRIRQDGELAGRIRHKYQIKNTVGYGLNAFLDYDHPLEILAHLLIGAEGTLGFIAEAVLRTIPDRPFKSTALLFFDSPRTACEAIPALRDSGAAALEFMDRAALRSVEHLPGVPAFLKELGPGVSCILSEYQEDTEAALEERMRGADRCAAGLPLVRQTPYTRDEKEQALYWKLRKGMYPSVAALREKGTSVMLEDVAVPVVQLGEAIAALQDLFVQFGYDTAIVFGHAKEGNLHFLVSQPIATAEDISQFGAFNDALAELVIGRFGGSLKAEHGTGRQIAPYVEAEWGGAAYAIMKTLKELIDPAGLLNPGVILTDSKTSHLEHLKSLPVVEEEVDKCVECGYCEHRCPSRNFTLSPRQRIVLRRSLARLKAEGDMATHDAIAKDYQYYGMDTCAVDGMCATDCPVQINTGELIKRLRRENHSEQANKMAMRVANNFGTVERVVKGMLRIGGGVRALLGKKSLYRMTGFVRKGIPAFPLWMESLAGPVSVHAQEPAAPAAVYFVGCMNRMMGKDAEGKESSVEVMLRVAKRAGLEMLVPSDLTGTCCGQAFSSKGFVPAYQQTVNSLIGRLWNWTREGRLPVVLDISSCTGSLKTCRPYLTPENQVRYDKLRILDSLEWAADFVLPKLTIRKKKEEAVFHPVCSLTKMGIGHKLNSLAASTTERPVIPAATGCCGMAGDRGFYYPGLTMAATHNELAEVKEGGPGGSCGYYSTGKPCEMAMSDASGKAYRSIFYLLDEVSGE